jgi:hypothetical protein
MNGKTSFRKQPNRFCRNFEPYPSPRTMTKPVPVLQLEQFQEPATLHPHLYVQLLEEHLT